MARTPTIRPTTCSTALTRLSPPSQGLAKRLCQLSAEHPQVTVLELSIGDPDRDNTNEIFQVGEVEPLGRERGVAGPFGFNEQPRQRLLLGSGHLVGGQLDLADLDHASSCVGRGWRVMWL